MTLPVCKRRRGFDRRRHAAQLAQAQSLPRPAGPEHRPEFRYSESRTIRNGDLFRVTGGPLFRDGRHGERGIFRFVSAWRDGDRWFIDCTRVERGAIDKKTGRLSINATHSFYVDGPAYPHDALPGLSLRPYSIHRLRDRTARKRGLQGLTRSAAARPRRRAAEYEPCRD